MYKILLIEDDLGILNALKRKADKWGLIISGVKDFRNILEEFTSFSPQIVLIDIGLPAYDGYYWCSEIRKISDVPIVFLTAISDKMNMIMAMNMGGDDYIVKPFDFDVLIAKIQALLRRSYDLKIDILKYEYAGFSLDIQKCILKYENLNIALTKNENIIMSLLLKAEGEIVSRECLIDALWETDSYIDDNTLSVSIGRLRKKLESNGIYKFIKTKFGVGYYLRDE